MSIFPEIAPRRGFRVRLDIKTLLTKYPEMTVMRQINKPASEVVDDSSQENGVRKLKQEAFSGVTLEEMSTNLLGGLFLDKHFNVRCKNDKSTTDWNGERMNGFTFEDADYAILDPCVIACFRIRNLVNLEFPYEIQIQNPEQEQKILDETTRIRLKENREIKKSILRNVEGKDDMKEGDGWVKVRHSPVFSNYWHVVVDSYPMDSERPFLHNQVDENGKRKNRTGLQKRAMRSFKFQLCQIGMVYPIEYPNLTPKDFKLPYWHRLLLRLYDLFF